MPSPSLSGEGGNVFLPGWVKFLLNLCLMRLLLSLSALCLVSSLSAKTYFSNNEFSWRGDSVVQGEFVATATDADRIISSYSANPGYFMPVEKEWKLKNDISAYPRLITPDKLHQAIYNMGLDEMVNAVEPDTTLRTGKEWAGVWTRDVSYSILLSMAYMQPEAARISLMKKVDQLGRIIQDTGSGGAWPVSSDRQIWAVAAWEVYKVTGSREWLEFIYPVIERSLNTDRTAFYPSGDGLVKGETSFIDWREQSYPRWMQTADIFKSESLSTSVVHAEAWKVLSEAASILGKKDVARDAVEQSEKIRSAINRYLWMPDKGYYAMYLYGRDHLIVNPRAETLGEALAIVWNVASKERGVSITENNPTTPFGPGVFYPQIADMPSYHNNSLWPWVGAWWTIANAKARNARGVVEGFADLFRPAALFCTNKENFRLDNGDIATELNSSNMLWCLSGNIAITNRILFGINYDTDRLLFAPFVPEVLAAERTLENFRYRDAILKVTVKGSGDKIRSFLVNGKEHAPFIEARKAKGVLDIVIVMDDNKLPDYTVNHQLNRMAPLTPVAWLENNTLCWNPIEYIDHYVVLRDGKRVAETTTTTFDASQPGEYQVIGVDSEGTEGFASEPRSIRSELWLEFPEERTAIVSDEISYPASDISGYRGAGFVEIDHKTESITIPVEVKEPGRYFIALRYANGNGPVNTESKCAIRTVSVDGNRLGIVVMPHRGRGNWSDWGLTNSLSISLSAGKHTLTISFEPDNENMDIKTNHALLDAVRLVKSE